MESGQLQWRATAGGMILAAMLGGVGLPVTAQADVVRGTHGADVLSDTGRADVIRAKSSADDIYVMNNRDRRRDRVLCGRGFDQVFVNCGRGSPRLRIG